MNTFVLDELCEKCKTKHQAMAFLEDGEATRYWDVPPWCSDCLEQGDWETYWLAMLKSDYERGILQS